MRILPLVLVAAFALAGCASTPSSPSTSSHGSTGAGASSSGGPSAGPSGGPSTGTQGGTSTSAPASAGNHAPVAALTATLVGLRANFTLSASDPDGDNLTYTFDADGKAPAERTGSGPFPVKANFTYAAAGHYNATLTVSDGVTSTVAHLALNATAAGNAPAPVTFSGTITEADPSASASQGCAYAAVHLLPFVPFPNNFGYLFDLPSGVGGWHFAFTKGAGMEADFIDAAGNVPASGAAGTVPASATQVAVCGTDPANPNADFTLALTSP